ncbi:MAG TPA: hypothetical protein VKM55_25155 [Candidatus Lokiarchaeia archaeon]|nr:hypothetical protein [Candidatus Lokiarchaeia archaeon]
MLCDVDKLLNELNLSAEEKENLIQDVRADFPDDEMLFELHLIRVVRHIQETNVKSRNVPKKKKHGT